MDIRVSMVVVAQFFPHSPVPVCANAISPAIPYPEYKPGKGSEREGEYMQFPGAGKDPPCHIEHGEQGVKHKKENIEKSVPHAVVAISINERRTISGYSSNHFIP